MEGKKGRGKKEGRKEEEKPVDGSDSRTKWVRARGEGAVHARRKIQG